LVVLLLHLKFISSSEVVTRNLISFLFIQNAAPAGADVWDPAALADTGWEEGSAALPQHPHRLPSAFRMDHHSSTTEEKREAELVDSMSMLVDLLLSSSIYVASWCTVKCESVF